MYCDYADIRNGVDINYGTLLSTQLLLESVVLNWSTIKEAKVKKKANACNQKEVLLDSWRIYHKLFGLSRLGLSRFISSHRILFILPALYYSCGQPNRAAPLLLNISVPFQLAAYVMRYNPPSVDSIEGCLNYLPPWNPSDAGTWTEPLWNLFNFKPAFLYELIDIWGVLHEAQPPLRTIRNGSTQQDADKW